MDEYLSEKEQIEQIKNWWKENGWFLIGGAALALLGYVGFNQYGAYQERVAEEAAALYQELRLLIEDDDRAGADERLSALVEEHSGSAYLDFARFLIAEDNLIRDTDRSIAELEAVMAGSEDEEIARIARLRLARVLIYDEQFERALEVLDIPDSGEFAARYSEVRGDAYVATGEFDAARLAYTDALLSGANGTVNRESVELKLNDLPVVPAAEAIE